jgi:manganese/iron transport system substrate-binding protein
MESMTKVPYIPLVLTALLTGLGSCAPIQTRPGQPDSVGAEVTGKPLVVATSPVLCDLTQQIAVDTIDLKCLIPPDTDPHVYQSSAADGRAIETAKLILYNGYGFESKLIKLITANTNPAPKVAVGEQAVPQPLLGEDHEHEAGHEGEHEAGHEAEQESPDPHIWHNVEYGIQMAAVVEQSLIQLQPDQAQLYTANAEKLTAELEQIDRWIQSQVATIPPSARKLVTTHDALGYYADAYGLEIEGALSGVTTEEKPTAARVKELVEDIKATQVPTIFAETSINPKLIDTVAQEANVKVAQQALYADTLGAPGSAGETYPKMLISNTEAIVKGLGGQFTPWEAKASPQS